MVRSVYDVDDLLRTFRSGKQGARGRLIALSGLGRHDGYNPSGPILNGSHPMVYVRVEQREKEADSWSVPFRQVTVDSWEIDGTLPRHRVEDPSVTAIHGTCVVSGVRITARTDHSVQWETVFLRGADPARVQEFTHSPAYMKDVRLLELEDGGIGVFTRPWGTPETRARIGYTEIRHLDELTPQVMEAAPVLDTQPVAGQWWGANAVYNLGNGQIGVLGHIAKWDGPNRSYYPVAFVFDRFQRAIVGVPRIITERSCFPEYPPKRPDLYNVIFPSWIDRERGLLFGGLSDTTIGVIPIDDPFETRG